MPEDRPLAADPEEVGSPPREPDVRRQRDGMSSTN